MAIRRLMLLGVVAAILASAGCGSVMIRPLATPDLLEDGQDSALSADGLSPRTLQTLRRHDLETAFQAGPRSAYQSLHALALEEPRPDLLFALAELCYLIARRSETTSAGEACGFYYLCAGYSYHYLFDVPASSKPQAQDPLAARLGPVVEGESPFDPRFRLACALYNAGLAKCIRAAQREGHLDPRQQLHVPTPDGKGFVLSVQHHGFPWRPDEFGRLLFSNDYQVVGLANLHRTHGLGVPLIGTRIAPDVKAPGDAFYPREVSFPVTAFFRFEGTLAELGALRCGQLELLNPLAVQTVTVKGRPVPLETDLTTPLAYFLSRTDLEGVELTGFLKPDRLEARSGIYMFEPYQPGKIPVLMVHGLLASPLTWSAMFNDLRADPQLRERFQFWFYLYPTGNPYLESAADLREALAKLRTDLDPEGRDPALNEMILVGHSMGGLVAKLLTTDSGNDFWREVSKNPFAQLRGSPQTKAALERIFFFERQSGIQRVVFLATPHRGSNLSPSLPGRVATRLVEMPKTLRLAARDLMQLDPELANRRLPTSVDLLAPEAPALMLMARRPLPEGIHFHSIIGQAPSGSPLRDFSALFGGDDKHGDGVVPYRSAHLEGVDSEIVVEADHIHVHHHPRAILEVRRILLEHLPP